MQKHVTKRTFYKILTRIISFTLFFLLLLNISPTVLAKDEFKKSLDRTITLQEDGWVQITEKHSLSWTGKSTYFPMEKNFDYFYIYPPYADQKVIENENVRDIVVTTGKGSSATFVKTQSSNGLELKVGYYSDLSLGSQLTFTLTYKSNLQVKKAGGVYEIAHSSLSSDFKSRQASQSGNYDEVYDVNYKFIVPVQLGEIGSVIPEPKSMISENNAQILSFSADQIIDKSIRIVVGKKRYIKFSLMADISQTTASIHEFFQQFVNNEVEIALPNDVANIGQKVYYESISPKPIAYRLDDNGNLIAKIPVNASESTKLEISGYASIEKQNFDPTAFQNAILGQISEGYVKYQGQALPEWPTDEEKIVEIANKQKAANNSFSGTLRNSLTFVTDTLTYKNIVDANSLIRQGALGALNSKTGVCMEYSDLLLTIVRAQGIPARTVYGDGVGSFVDQSINGIGHQWVEVWNSATGWIPVDPTWSDQGEQIIGPDLDHFIWYKASDSPNDPPGFSCNTWDDTTPCKQFVLINTTPVEALPQLDGLTEVSHLETAIAGQDSWLSTQLREFGSTYFGRFVFSAVTMNVLLAVVIYLFSLTVIKIVWGQFKKMRKKV